MVASLPESCPQCEHSTANMDSANRFCPQCRFPLMVVANKYRLLRLLSEGGFGNVYLAHHIHLIEDSARVIKVIRPEVMNQPGMETRFFREVRVTASLSQKNEHIVRIYDDFGEEPQLGYYYVMEYLEGQSLYHLLTEPFDIQQALHIFDQLCEAISEAHRGSVVHRDLKPDNLILLQKRQYPDFVKVLDFGIAKPLKGTIQTRLTQGALGTPFYMSPEQCLAKDIGPASDIYAMGVILYEMLAGKLPFDFEEDAELFAILHAHITQPPRPLREVRPDVPQGLEEVVHKALSKKAEDRYVDVDQFRQSAALFIDEDTPYKALTSSSRLRALRPSSSHTPSLEQSSPFPLGGGVAPTPPPGTRSAPIPAIAPVPVSSGAPSGSAQAPSSEQEAYPGAGTREWRRDDKVADGAPTSLDVSIPQALLQAGQKLDDNTTPEPRPVDPRLSQLDIPSQSNERSKTPLVAFLLLLLLAGGAAGTWYYLIQKPQQNPPSQPLARQNQPTNDRTTQPTGTTAPVDAGATSPQPGRQLAPPAMPPIAPPVKLRRRRPPRRRRTKPRKRYRRRRPPRRRRLAPPVRRTIVPRRIAPILRRITPPRRRVPGRIVALAPPTNAAALKAYNRTGSALASLFQRRASRGRQFVLAKTLLKQYKKLSSSQKGLSTTHLYQSIAYIRRINQARRRIKRMRWMRNPYQTQASEYRRVMRQYNRYMKLAGGLFRYPKSRYYLCAFFYTGEAKERMYHLLEDAVHAPLPPPGFRHQRVPTNVLTRESRRLRRSAVSTYRKGVSFASSSRYRSCLRNIRIGLRRLKRY